MRLILLVGPLFLLIAFTSFVTVENTFATVGGPTLIYEFVYNPLDESVYYIEQDHSGRGCPPELFKLSLNSSETKVAYSCDEGERLASQNGYDYSSVGVKINEIIEDFKFLAPLSLKANNISVDIDFVNAENYSPEFDEVIRRNFIATIYQNEVKVDEFTITGCSLNQPFVFHGYAIPGFEKKIMVLLSTKGDCFEGGYTKETLHMISNVSNIDKTPSVNFYKGQSALIPNEDSLVVYESDEVITTTEQSKELPTANLFLVASIFLLAGIVLGMLMYKLLISRRG